MTGIDTYIEKIRTTLASDLWTGSTYTAYGRVHRNERDRVLIPEIYNSTKDEYEDVLLQDNLDGLSFFDVEPQRGIDKANVVVYFAVDLKALYPSITERADEYALKDAVNTLISTSVKVNEVDGILTGYDAFELWGLTKERPDNMQPYFLFSVEIIMSYHLIC